MAVDVRNFLAFPAGFRTQPKSPRIKSQTLLIQTIRSEQTMKEGRHRRDATRSLRSRNPESCATGLCADDVSSLTVVEMEGIQLLEQVRRSLNIAGACYCASPR
jgi:hypothetical protein